MGRVRQDACYASALKMSVSRVNKFTGIYCCRASANEDRKSGRSHNVSLLVRVVDPISVEYICVESDLQKPFLVPQPLQKSSIDDVTPELLL